MSKSFDLVDPDIDTFYSWAGKTNDMRSAFGNTVTTAPNTAGDMTIGNGFVTGILGANTLTASIIKGGNVQANAIITIVSNTVFGNSSLNILSTYADAAVVSGKTFTTTSTSPVILDQFDKTVYRSGKYLISIKEIDALDYQSTEIMFLHDGTDVYTTEYATLLTDSTLAVFVANTDTSNVRIYVTPTTQNNVIKYHRTLMTV